MKSIVVKTSAKDKALQAVTAKVAKREGHQVFLNSKFKFKNFGYQELIFPTVSDKDPETAKQVFQSLMHEFAHHKLWVECMNVTIVTKHAPEYGSVNKGARYNGADLEIPYRDVIVGTKMFKGKEVPKILRLYDENMSAVQRHMNLDIDGADRLGALNNKKKGMRYDKLRWYTDGIMEEVVLELKDEEGNVVGEEPTGEFALNFDFEIHGHSEQYSNYKHFRRQHYFIEWGEWDESSLNNEPAPRRVKKEKETFETSSDDFSTLTGQALFDALNAGNKRPKSKLK